MFLSICLTQLATAKVSQITGFRVSSGQDKTRLVFDATSALQYKTTVASKKIIVNIKQAKLTASLSKVKLAKTPVSSVTHKKIKNDLHLTLNLKKPIKLKHFVLKKPYRLVLDLYPSGKKVTAKKKAVAKTTKVAKKIEKPKKLRKVIVVIDPGHGGKDPGAVGRRGTREKHITLSVAKKLQKIINGMKGFQAYLTRNGDYYVSLRKRLSIAHKKRADMFISIHADAYRNRTAHGASVFALSQRGATSEAARWLAKKENESELGKVISNKNELLRSVLIDLAQTATIGSSLDIGGRILRSLSSIAKLHSKRVEQAAFVVLKAPDVPSLLVEVGFLSYSKEERKLRSAKYQQQIAAKIAAGIKSYFLRKPPFGTYLASWKK